MKLMTILIIALISFLGIVLYKELKQTNIVNEVQEFVSNITILAETKEKPKIPETIQDEANILQETEQKNEANKNIQVYKHYYNQLENEAKIIYNAIEENRENIKTGTYEINLGSQFSSLLSKENGEDLLGQYYQSAIESYTYDNPDVFYIDYEKMFLNIETTTRRNKKTYKVLLNSGEQANYLTEDFSTKEAIEEALNEIEKIKSYFVQNKKIDTYENIKLVHDYLVESIEYDQTISESNIYNLYGALINKKCVCAGYANAFKYLMDSLEIPCIIVPGLATNSEGNTENHAWNYVQLNENWYVVDCTWDDPILIGPGFLTNSSKYKYFLKGEKEINKTHIPNGQLTKNGKIFEFPVLSQTNYK